MTATELDATVTRVRELWSVTTLIKMGLGTSEAIVNWVGRRQAEIGVDHRATVESMLANGETRDDVVAFLTRKRFQKQKATMERGSVLHAIIETIELGGAPHVEPELEPYIEQFGRWVERFQPRYLLAEAPVYNVEYGYAGTLDGILEIGGRRLLFDVKTTEYPPDGEKARPPWPEVALQLVAYRRATEVGLLAERRETNRRRYYVYDPNAQHEPMPEVDGAIVIVLSPYDCTAIPVRTDEYVWRTFRHVQMTAAWTQNGSHDLFGPPLTTVPNEAA